MTMDLFKEWLHSLDDSHSHNSLLLIGSCGAHGTFTRGRSSVEDPLTGETWKHLRIERLPPNSTSVTQPLDQGIISVFKRRYLEMLSNKAITKEYATGEKIANGEAWSLIPYAWSHVKPLTVRHCFCKAGVLTKAQVDKLEQESIRVEERLPLYPSMTDMDESQVKQRYVRLIASAMDGDRIQFSLDQNQKDAQDIAEEIKQRMRNKIVRRYGSRERSSSIENDAVESLQLKEGEVVKTMLFEMLKSEDPIDRRTARHVIRKSKQK